jgi:hypothetical protein
MSGRTAKKMRKGYRDAAGLYLTRDLAGAMDKLDREAIYYRRWSYRWMATAAALGASVIFLLVKMIWL